MTDLPRAFTRLSVALLAVTLPSLATAQSYGGGSIALGSGGYAQNFDTLATTGTSSTLPNGWAALESGTNANTTYTAGTGSSTTGDIYSFGAAGSAERAFGTLRSGSLIPTIGAIFTNSTGASIASLLVGYTGEQWRNGSTSIDSLNFQYSLVSTDLSDPDASSNWISVAALNFVAPQNATVGALDGNAAANRQVLSATIANLSLAPGATFAFRWLDADPAGADDGLGIDDFTLSATAPTAPVPEPASWAMMIGGFAIAGAALRRCTLARTTISA